MVKTTFKQLEKRFNSVYMASDFYLSIWTCWNTELQRVHVNQCQFCVLKPKKSRLSFLLGSLQLSFFPSTCFTASWSSHRLAMNVLYFLLNAPAPFHCVLFYVLAWYFEVESLSDKTYRLFNFKDRRDNRWKKLIVNTTLNAWRRCWWCMLVTLLVFLPNLNSLPSDFSHWPYLVAAGIWADSPAPFSQSKF